MTNYRAHFIGHGYESVKFVIIEAGTAGEAIKKAKTAYTENGWDFWFYCIEVEEI